MYGTLVGVVHLPASSRDNTDDRYAAFGDGKGGRISLPLSGYLPPMLSRFERWYLRRCQNHPVLYVQLLTSASPVQSVSTAGREKWFAVSAFGDNGLEYLGSQTTRDSRSRIRYYDIPPRLSLEASPRPT